MTVAKFANSCDICCNNSLNTYPHNQPTFPEVNRQGAIMTITKRWDRPAITAEVRRQGKTLTGIARDAGLYDSACRQGIIGASRAGAEAIARALGIPFRDMFPDSYTRGRHDEGKTSSNKSCNASQNSTSPTDTIRGAA
ncbi:helix-turn-helix domain-containing protein [Rhizobium johnstonii]|uniref:helix-turn-helix domain-containing protein n=1 Tax=Rhizobium johnstonii TaxID=3019933 RepID=UPI003F991840